MDELNIKLKTLRKEHGYTQEQLSDFLNLTRSAISNYELGLNEPSLDTMVAIADLYGVSLDWLMGRTNLRYNFNLENKENLEVIIKLYESLKDFDITKR
jgi:transcriptional regulator with XRE-family HTH domain